MAVAKPTTPPVPGPKFFNTGATTLSTPSDEIVQAILSGNSMITRRAEIFEQDGITPFVNDQQLTLTGQNAPRMIDGAVSVSYGRVDRRNNDITFDNSDGKLSHNPNGFWYDKVIKTFRGVQWVNSNTTPNICIVGVSATTGATVISVLRQLGYDRISYSSSTDPNFYNQFDVLVGWAQGADLTAAQYSILQNAYLSGQNILTFCNFATPTSVPLIATTSTRSGTSNWTVAAPTVDNPFINSIYPYQVVGSTGETFPLTVRATARIAATSVYSATNGAAAVYEQAANGAQWFHYHPRLETTPINQTYKRYRSAFLTTAIAWLYNYEAMRSYEVQTGEFTIDKIVQKRFPAQVEVTCRDYWKRLTLSQFYTSTTFTQGANLDTVVQSLAANAGITKFRLNSGATQLGADATFDRASARDVAITQLCTTNNVEVFFDAAGYLVTRPFLDPSTSPLSLLLQTGTQGVGNLVDWTKTSDDGQLYNIIVVTGQSDVAAKAGQIYQGLARNDNPNSPTSTTNIGDRPYFYTSVMFTSNAQCTAYANSLLSVHALEQFQLDFYSLVFPWLEVGNIVGFVDPDPTVVGEPTMFLLTDFTIPNTLGAMTGSAKRLSIVGGNDIQTATP